LIEGGPDLFAEVAASSASYDLHDKLNAYRRNGIREYVVHRVLEQKVDWFVLKEGRFEALPPRPTASCAAPFSRAFGLTRPHSFGATPRPFWL
jgi:Uma2 family endonuclease